MEVVTSETTTTTKIEQIHKLALGSFHNKNSMLLAATNIEENGI